MNWLAFVVPKLLILFCVLFLIEVMSLEKTDIKVSLIIFFAIQALKAMRTEFTLFGFKFMQISIKVCFATLSKMSVVFNFIEAVIFNISWILSMVCKYSISPFLVVFVLGNSWVYVCSVNSSNIIVDIEAFVD